MKLLSRYRIAGLGLGAGIALLAFGFAVYRRVDQNRAKWINYGTPISVAATSALGAPTHVVLTSSRIAPPAAWWREWFDAAGEILRGDD